MKTTRIQLYRNGTILKFYNLKYNFMITPPKNSTVLDKLCYSIDDKDSFSEWLAEQNGIAVAMNARKFLTTDPKLTEIINYGVPYPDGRSGVLGLSKQGIYSESFPGYLLWQAVLHKIEGKRSVYLVGAKESVIQRTVDKLQQEFPKLNILGWRNGYLSREEELNLFEELKKHQPGLVLMAMGTPKQEYLMAEAYTHHKALYMGLGGSFDVYVGDIKPVPLWWKKLFRTEFLYRVMQDWKKLPRLMNTLKFLSKLYFGHAKKL